MHFQCGIAPRSSRPAPRRKRRRCYKIKAVNAFGLTCRPGLTLRILEERHATPFFRLVDGDREHLRQWLPWVDKAVEEEQILDFIRSGLRQFADNAGFHCGIWWQGEPAGVIGFQRVNWLNRKVELGYWLSSGRQGQGLMTDAVRALTSFAFQEWGLHRVQIQCATGNHRSCAIPLRLGFTHEGVLREAQLLRGQFLDLNLYSMLARDWPTARNPQS